MNTIDTFTWEKYKAIILSPLKLSIFQNKIKLSNFTLSCPDSLIWLRHISIIRDAGKNFPSHHFDLPRKILWKPQYDGIICWMYFHIFRNYKIWKSSFFHPVIRINKFKLDKTKVIWNFSKLEIKMQLLRFCVSVCLFVCLLIKKTVLTCTLYFSKQYFELLENKTSTPITDKKNAKKNSKTKKYLY